MCVTPPPPIAPMAVDCCGLKVFNFYFFKRPTFGGRINSRVMVLKRYYGAKILLKLANTSVAWDDYLNAEFVTFCCLLHLRYTAFQRGPLQFFRSDKYVTFMHL